MFATGDRKWSLLVEPDNPLFLIGKINLDGDVIVRRRASLPAKLLFRNFDGLILSEHSLTFEFLGAPYN